MNQITENLSKAEALYIEIAAIWQQESTGQPHSNEVDKACEFNSLRVESKGARHFAAAHAKDEAGMGLITAAVLRPEPGLSLKQNMDDAACGILAQPNRAGNRRALGSEAIPTTQELPDVPASLVARYNRDELYKRAWTMPLYKLAKE